MKKVLYIYGGPEFHPTERGGKLLKAILEEDGRFEFEMTNDLDAFKDLSSKGYSTVVVYTTGFYNDLNPEREKGLLEFVKSGGGGFVGIHSATDSFRGSRAYIDMIGGEFLTHPPQQEFKVFIADRNHYLTIRMPDFKVYDEMYHLQSYDPTKVNVLAYTIWQGRQLPMVYTREYGKGRVVYLANGHSLEVLSHPDFQKLIIRSIAWTSGEELTRSTVNCGIFGYGNMGRFHAEKLSQIEGFNLIAVCDINPQNVELARKEYPNLKGYFTNLDDMLAIQDLELVFIVVPHNAHKEAVIRCLEAGKNVVVEKPISITVEEANTMISKAKEKGLMLSVFNNRRWDSDYLTIREIINKGLIGEIFHIEAGLTNYRHPGFTWRSDKEICGSVMHDWGAHFIDWILNLVSSKITQITGDFQKRMWHAVTNEDHGEVFIRFENGVTADFMVSNISAIPRPKWRILGTKGAIEATWNNEIRLVSYVSGIAQDSIIKVEKESYWNEYYRNILDHLLMKEALIVKPEQARRVIGVIEAGIKSAQLGTSVPPIEGCE
ncbi:MAG: ThuA domain-containing protein [bacterium]|nr:ThuA domain-containing protein [bacterium]